METDTDKFHFHEESEMYAQAAIKPNTLLRNGAYGIVMRGVQKCTCAGASLRSRNSTPLCCIKLDTATDPCCGSGGMFVQSAKFIRAHSGSRSSIAVYGEEANPDTWKMAKMYMALRGIEADFGPHQADTFTNDLHPQLKADFILANASDGKRSTQSCFPRRSGMLQSHAAWCSAP